MKCVAFPAKKLDIWARVFKNITIKTIYLCSV